MPIKRYVGILNATREGTTYNHGKITSTIAIMEARFANEPGHNGDLFDRWIADGRLDSWHFVFSELHYRDVLPSIPTGWNPQETPFAQYEDTDYLACFYYDINGVEQYYGPDPGWTIFMLQTDRNLDEQFGSFGIPYDLSLWS